jgi:hypothetical protein
MCSYCAVTSVVVIRIVIVDVAGGVLEEAEVFVETAFGRSGGEIFCGHASDAPFADGDGVVVGLLHHRAQGHSRRDGPVEFVVADVAMALREPGHERSARRCADGGGGIMLAHHKAAAREIVDVGSGEERFAGALARVLVEDADITVTKVVAEDEEDVGFGRRGRWRWRGGREGQPDDES